MLRRILLLTGLSTAVLVAAGCLGYRTTGLSKDITSVCVKPFINNSREPDVDIAATSATVREFQKDGSLRVVNAGEADAILETTITTMTLSPLRFSKNRSAETTEFRLIVKVNFILTDRRTGRTITSGKGLKGQTTFSLEGDLSDSKRRALQPATQDLAHQVVAAVVEAW